LLLAGDQYIERVTIKANKLFSSDRHIDEVLEALKRASDQIKAGAPPQRVFSLARDFLDIADRSPASQPRSWRKKPLDVIQARLCAYHILNVNERSQRPVLGLGSIWARLGSNLAQSMNWEHERREFQMMELMSIAAQQKPAELRYALKRFSGFQEFSNSNVLKIEYHARQIDFLHMTGQWAQSSELAQDIILPVSLKYETPAFRAARFLTLARARLRTDGMLQGAREALDRAEDELNIHVASTGNPHEFFEYWLLCARAEAAAAEGQFESAFDALDNASALQIIGGLDKNFWQDADAYVRTLARS
jgi:hypothetical protein